MADEDNKTENAEVEVKVRKDIVPPQYRERYQANGGNNGDFIANELTASMTSGGTDSLNAVKAENNVPPNLWNTLNNGQQRMNLSNRLRASYLRGETITIAGKQYNLDAQQDEFGDLDATNESTLGKFIAFVGLTDNDRTRRALKTYFHDRPEKARLKAEREAEREQKAKDREAEKAKKAEEREAAKAAAAAAKTEDGAEASEKPKRQRRKKGDVEAAADAQEAPADA